MRRILIVICLLFVWKDLTSDRGSPYMFIAAPKIVNYYEPLIKALVMVESEGNNLAYGKHQDTGPFQITPIRLKDYNQRTGSSYSLKDCYDYNLSRKIFLYYTEGKGYESVARRWNGGPKGMNKRCTVVYWKRVKHEIHI